MSERYAVINAVDNKTMTADSAVQLLRYQILFDNVQNKTIARFVFGIRGERKVRSIDFDVRCYDKAKQELTALEDQSYYVPADCNGTFGKEKLYDVADKSETVDVHIKSVTFADGTTWDNSEDVRCAFVPTRARLDGADGAVIGKLLSAEGYRADNDYESLSGGWACTCGQVNGDQADKCCACQADRQKLAQCFDEEYVADAHRQELYREAAALDTNKATVAQLQQSAELFESLGDYEDSAIRAAECRDKAEALTKKQSQAKAKRKKLILAIVIIALVIAIGIGGAFGGIAIYTAVKYPGMSFEQREDGYVVKGKSNAKGALVIPSTYLGKSVTGIGYQAFRNCAELTSVTIPDSVTYIGRCAFQSCSGLTSVTIGNGVTTIGISAFSDCSSLTSVTIPGNVTNIDWWAFASCSSLTSVTIGNGVTEIGYEAFSGCRGLTSIAIPDSVTKIGNSAFYGCEGLTTVTIGNGVTEIGYEVFSGCIALTSLSIPDSVTTIGSSAFSDCSSLTSVTIGNGVTRIRGYAFDDCSALTDIYYHGTKAQWKAIEKVYYWNSDTGSFTIHCTDGNLGKYD